jgi:hypothetical protein
MNAAMPAIPAWRGATETPNWILTIKAAIPEDYGDDVSTKSGQSDYFIP